MSSPLLVTGAGRRIGLHLARALLKMKYEVLIHYHTRTDAIDDLEGRGVPAIQGDFDHRKNIFDFVEEVKSTTSNLAGIIHNASMYSTTKTDRDHAARQFDDFFHVHMMAPFLINEGLLDHLKRSEESPADIIALTDIYADQPEPGIDIYSSTKAGLKSLVESGAQKYAPDVKVNAIAPGPVLFDDEADEDYKQRVLDKTPLNREGGVESIAKTVLMILDNDFLTGAHIPVDGGRRLCS